MNYCPHCGHQLSPLMPGQLAPNAFPYNPGIKPKVPRCVLCPCNPSNGGNGICMCVNGMELVDDTR